MLTYIILLRNYATISKSLQVQIYTFLGCRVGAAPVSRPHGNVPSRLLVNTQIILACRQKNGKLFWNICVRDLTYISNSDRLRSYLHLARLQSADQVVVESDYCVIILSLIHI